MSEGTAEGFFIAGTIPFIAAGALHIVLTLIDTRQPTFFKPIDGRAIPTMESTGVQLFAMFPGARPERRSFWRAWIGFNVSHGIGATMFGLLLLLVALNDFGVVERVDAIRPLSAAVGLAYFLLSLRFWFYAPAIATGIGTACFLVAALA